MISQLIQQYRFCGTGIQYDPLAIQDQIINSLIGVPLVPLSKTVEVGEKDKKEKVEIFIVASKDFNLSSYEPDESLVKTIELNGNGTRIDANTFWLDCKNRVFATLNQEVQERLIPTLRNMKSR